MDREPPEPVKQKLRDEIGSCCPVDGCGSPHLTWHHFDPPWAVEKHHRPEGMIALCADHHNKADVGAFTVDQLRRMKASSPDRALITSRFEWRRQDLIAVVGGNFYYEVPIPVQIGPIPLVQLDRSETGELLVGLQVVSPTGPKLAMKDNEWVSINEPGIKVKCPPSGRVLRIQYPDGTRIRVEFREISDVAAFDKRYPPAKPTKRTIRMMKAMGEEPSPPKPNSHGLDFAGVSLPTTTVEIDIDLPALDVRLRSRRSQIRGMEVDGAWICHSPAGLLLAG